MQKFIGAILTLMVLVSCKQTKEPVDVVAKVEVIEKPPVLHYGFNFDDFNVPVLVDLTQLPHINFEKLSQKMFSQH